MKQALAPENFDRLLESLKAALDQGAAPIAAFDADGTLWDTDIGELYFQYIIDNKFVKLPEDPWGYYLGLRNGSNPPDGYLWLAQILKDVPLAEAQKWSDALIEVHRPLPVFEQQQTLVKQLKDWGVEVYVVTASVKWAVEGPAKLYDIPNSHVIGVTTRISEGLITDAQDGPITWKPGKVEGLLKATDGKHPFFCAGNSSGDSYLLKCATHHALALQTVPEDHMIFDSEAELAKMAEENGWWMHDFRVR